MCPSRDHMYCLDLIPGDLKLYSLTRINIPLLNQSVACHNDEKLPLGVMPVLAFSNSRSADVDGDLSAVLSMHQFCKRTSVIYIHLYSSGSDAFSLYLISKILVFDFQIKFHNALI